MRTLFRKAKDGGYGVNIFRSAEDDCFVATFPEFPNLSAFGDTWEAAVADARIVLDMALEYLAERGVEPPRPVSRPASGRASVLERGAAAPG